MNRKGDVDLIAWFPRLIMLILAVLIIVVYVGYFTNRDIDSADAHMATFAFRLVSDGELFTYVDPALNRAYPGMIEYERFSTSTLDQAMRLRQGEWAQISAELVLKTVDCPFMQGQDNIKTIYSQQETYTRYAAFSDVKGKGASTLRTFRYPVTVLYEEERCPGFLRVSVVRPNI